MNRLGLTNLLMLELRLKALSMDRRLSPQTHSAPTLMFPSFIFNMKERSISEHGTSDGKCLGKWESLLSFEKLVKIVQNHTRKKLFLKFAAASSPKECQKQRREMARSYRLVQAVGMWNGAGSERLVSLSRSRIDITTCLCPPLPNWNDIGARSLVLLFCSKLSNKLHFKFGQGGGTSVDSEDMRQ